MDFNFFNPFRIPLGMYFTLALLRFIADNSSSPSKILSGMSVKKFPRRELIFGFYYRLQIQEELHESQIQKSSKCLLIKNVDAISRQISEKTIMTCEPFNTINRTIFSDFSDLQTVHKASQSDDFVSNL
eukprot:TRINITY_DN2883_c0_g1_i6.p1 TRINITY_DN2883_c0_g1~~TRINITY_DN2883_c0_g1_i6.p1  ORF type:complete len:129 (+),score=32.69 TRINITY_DN2883_c0_g1_i6:660-1046(+)